MAYKPFKMKGHTLPGINQRSEGNTDLPDGRSGSSPLQDIQSWGYSKYGGWEKGWAAKDSHNKAHKRGDDPHKKGEDKKTETKGEDKKAETIEPKVESPAKQGFKRLSELSDKEKKDLFKIFGPTERENLIEKRKRQMKETQIFSPEQTKKRAKASRKKKFVKDVIKAIKQTGIPHGSGKSPTKHKDTDAEYQAMRKKPPMEQRIGGPGRGEVGHKHPHSGNMGSTKGTWNSQTDYEPTGNIWDKEGEDTRKNKEPLIRDKKSPAKWVQAVAALAPVVMDMMKKKKEE